MSRFTPKKAVRSGQKARVGLAGPSGSGKTWSALELATTLAAGAPILGLDTERGSMSLYADYFDFDVIEWDPPYDPRQLADAIEEFGDQYTVVIIDSGSHFWEAEGGTRDIVDAAAARARGNSFAGWKEGTPAQNDMISAILLARCHVIMTMRSKTEYVLEEKNGRQVPRKVGMAPIQRAGIEYEFTVTADLDYEHTLLVDKTRCHPLAGRMFKMGHTVEFGEVLRDWLSTAEPAPQSPPHRSVGLIQRLEDLPEEAAEKVLVWFNKPVTEWASTADEHLDRLEEVIRKAELAAGQQHQGDAPAPAGADAPVGSGEEAPGTASTLGPTEQAPEDVQRRLAERIEALPDDLKDDCLSAFGAGFGNLDQLMVADVPEASALISGFEDRAGPTAATLASRAASHAGGGA